ncbi:MAG: peptidoglycan DL-endopeptidase CwlO [Solirubrobacteraceae bacterium]
MRAFLATTIAVLLLAAPAAAARRPGDWDRHEQRAVAQAGVMAPLDDGEFHGERPIAGSQLQGALHALAGRLAVAPVAVPTGRVSVAGFDRLLVAQLGLADVAQAVQSQAIRAGLAPPPRFGSEVVARLLGLRFNHPVSDEREELYPWDAITRAEAAYSLARVLAFGGWETQSVRGALARFVLPSYGPRTRRALRLAVQRIGMPYIWGGVLDRTGGWQAHGGYDCSGFAWRVFKLSGLARIGGRTAAQQAAEIPRSRRLALSQVHPGDLLFFGPGRIWQKATEKRIVHEGIALSGDWMIHSSGQGVFVSPLFDSWRAHEFTWARRVL